MSDKDEEQSMRINQNILDKLDDSIKAMAEKEGLLKDRAEALKLGLGNSVRSCRIDYNSPQVTKKILPGISLCMIVKNEEKNILGVLQDAQNFADEIIIVDTGSTDATKVIASGLPKVQLADFPWCNDFSKARNYGIQLASREWIVWLDADDRVSKESASRISAIAKTTPPTPQEAYSFQVENVSSFGTVALAFQQIRMVPRARGIVVPWFKDAVHEQLWTYITENAITMVPRMDISVQHTGYQTEEMIEAKRKRNKAILFSSENSPRRDYFLGLDESNSANSYGALSYFLHTFTAFKGLTADLESRFMFLIGLQFERLEAHALALSWYRRSSDQDAIFRIAECCERLGDLLEAKRNYEIYWNEDTRPSFYGELSSIYKPQALKRLQEISEGEYKHWKEQK
jgi:glycosyltransferase involved in cell wall biosynthesis